MSESLTDIGAITLFVEDRERSKSFYENVFQLDPIYEDEDAVVFRFDNLLVNLLEARAAAELVAPAPVADSQSGSRFELTIGVADADAVVADLQSRGVEFLNGPVNREWGMRTAAFADPDGHIWEIAQKIET